MDGRRWQLGERTTPIYRSAYLSIYLSIYPVCIYIYYIYIYVYGIRHQCLHTHVHTHSACNCIHLRRHLRSHEPMHTFRHRFSGAASPAPPLRCCCSLFQAAMAGDTLTESAGHGSSVKAPSTPWPDLHPCFKNVQAAR